MKGDFSRLTFRPGRNYVRVLQQQGRPQLDADWNEQAAILLDRIEALAEHVVGGTGDGHGAPFDRAGFEITPADNAADNFRIGAGCYYIDGISCVCEEPTTYASQPLPPAGKPDLDGRLMVYLEAWEALITPVDEPSLLEPALAGLQTTLRSQIVWQVKTHQLAASKEASPDPAKLRAECRELVTGWRKRGRGLLRARLSGAATGLAGGLPGGSPGGSHAGGGHFRGLENLLYRIEVHDGGPAGKATFKWSRENGAALLPLHSLLGSVAKIAAVARPAMAGLAPGTWLELSDRPDRLLGRSRPMVQVAAADSVAGTITLAATPEVPSFKHGERTDLALRRWDQVSTPGGVQAGPAGMAIVEGEHEAHWIDIEDGIQVQFQAAPHRHHYNVGDYWLIPARTADEGTLLVGHEPRPPDGVVRHYAPLAVFVPGTGKVAADLRPTFQALAALQDQVNQLQDEVEHLRDKVAALEKAK